MGGCLGDPQESPQETPWSFPSGSREAPGNSKFHKDLSLILVDRLTWEASQLASRKSNQEPHRGLPDISRGTSRTLLGVPAIAFYTGI